MKVPNFISPISRAKDSTTDTHLNTNDYSTQRIDFKLSMTRSSFFYQSSRLWAALPDQVKSSRSKSVFKKKCKDWVKLNVTVKP